MKNLLLTSAGMNVKDEILKILPKPPKETKLAHIITASHDEKDTSYVTKDSRIMEEVGFQVEEVDIASKNESELRQILKSKDVIYVQGGGTFYLMKCVSESGFDKVVRELIEKGIIYIGVSAGSYIACPSIEMAAWKHNHDKHGLTSFDGMNLVPFLLFVHYLPEYASNLRRHIKESPYEVKILTDDQAILVRGDKYQLVGKGPEIIL